ncbi:MAG: tyrosine-type recombinase/integrase [Bacillota bacterium]
MAKKRGNGEGTLQHRADGRWAVSFFVGYEDNGKPLRKTAYGKTQQEAIDNGRKLKERIDKGIIINKRMPFEEWADRWYKDFKGSVSDATYEGYAYTLSLVKKLIGTKYLYSIKALDIEKSLKQLIAEGYSGSQISKVKAMFNQIFRKAEANGIIEKNPVQLTEKTRMPKKASSKDSFSIAEITTLLKELPKDRTGHAIRLSISCGLRPQELLGLEKEHIEEDGSMIHIRQAVQLLHGKVQIGGTKSISGVRDIPVPVFANESARFLREQAQGFVMKGKFDLPMNATTWRDYYKKAVSAVEGVRLLPPHCCRHTYITLLHASGVDFDTIQALAGQSDEDATRGYMHIKEDVTMRAVGLLEQTLQGGLS